MTESNATITLVAIDDDPVSLELVRATLTQPEVEVLTATQPAEGLELALRRRAEIVLVDLWMPEMGGIEVLERLLAAAPETEVVLVTGHYSSESAVEAIRKGASDYLNKPVPAPLLRQRVGRLIAQARQRRVALELETELLRASQLEGIVGASAAMREVFLQVRRVAPHFRTALISGPTGSGKELVGAALHRLSPAGGNRFAACNCPAVAPTLFESELFGHLKGAFTGAAGDKAGLFEYASGGTVFLDEIGDMRPETQAKLLRVLENGEVQRIGSPAAKKVDVRVIAATKGNVREMIRDRQFREDLFYRLSMVEIRVPALAERKEDLPLLERYFIGQFAAQYGKPIRGITARAQRVLARHDWPGNVRELRKVLGSACMMALGDAIDVRDLPEAFRARAAEQAATEDEGLLTLEEIERRHVRRVLERTGGNKVRAAKILGINRATIYRILEEQQREAARAAGE